MYLRATSIKRGIHHACLLLVLSIMAFSLVLPVYAQDDPPQETAVQELTGRVGEGGRVLYTVPNLGEGDTLYVYLENISGDLDPLVGLSDTKISPAVIDAFVVRLEEAIAEDDDPLRSLPSIFDEFLVAWDDDSGPGYAARFEYPVPGEGEFQLLVAPSPARPSAGDFRLLLGINQPQALTGQAETTGEQIAFLDLESSQFEVSVQEFTGKLTPEKPEKTRDLRRMRAGDTLYARVETIAGDLAPSLGLWDYGEKLLSVSNLAGKQPRAGLSWTANEDVEDLRLMVFASTEGGSPAEGEYRLLVGINEPDVLTSAAQANDQTVLKQPIDVKVGVKLHQITGVDQVSENFGAVAALLMEWQDPELAFSPDNCQCSEMVFTGVDFQNYVISKGAEWPQHSFSNQQGNRWTQNRNAVVYPDGRVVYYERFTTDFQAPDFDFTSFPFDTQQLYIRVESLFQADTFTFSAPERLSGIGEQLGEEEWYVVDSDLETSTQEMRDVLCPGIQGEAPRQLLRFPHHHPHHPGHHRVLVHLLPQRLWQAGGRGQRQFAGLCRLQLHHFCRAAPPGLPDLHGRCLDRHFCHQCCGGGCERGAQAAGGCRS